MNIWKARLRGWGKRSRGKVRLSDAAKFARMLRPMRGQPIPQRLPVLSWRRPAFIWTPVALALAIGWPAALFYDDRAPQRFAIAALLVVFALALITLGVSWAMGRAPRTRRIVVLHIVTAGVIAAIAAPFALTWLLDAVATSTQAEATEHFSLAMSFATTPLVIILGLPVVLVSGVLFAWVALKRERPARDDERESRYNVQPFR